MKERKEYLEEGDVLEIPIDILMRYNICLAHWVKITNLERLMVVFLLCLISKYVKNDCGLIIDYKLTIRE